MCGVQYIGLHTFHLHYSHEEIKIRIDKKLVRVLEIEPWSGPVAELICISGSINFFYFCIIWVPLPIFTCLVQGQPESMEHTERTTIDVNESKLLWDSSVIIIKLQRQPHILIILFRVMIVVACSNVKNVLYSICKLCNVLGFLFLDISSLNTYALDYLCFFSREGSMFFLDVLHSKLHRLSTSSRQRRQIWMHKSRCIHVHYTVRWFFPAYQ